MIGGEKMRLEYKIEGTAKKVLEGINKEIGTINLPNYVGVSRSAVSKHIAKLKRDGYIKLRTCSWEVTDYGKKFLE